MLFSYWFLLHLVWFFLFIIVYETNIRVLPTYILYAEFQSNVFLSSGNMAAT
jgi:hypothetical protein